MMANHIFRKLVSSSRLFMKKASWGCFVLVFDSSGEPAGSPTFSDSCVLGCSGTEFEIARTSCEDGVGATIHAPMDYESSMYCSTCCIRGVLGRFDLCSFWGPIEVPIFEFGEGDISTEAGTRRQRRSVTARNFRRLVSLAWSASASIDFSGRDHSRALLDQAFDDGGYHSNWGVSEWRPTAVPHLHCFVLDHFPADPAITPINATGSWLVFTVCYVYSTWPVCIQCVDYFSPSSWMGCIRDFCLAVSTGPDHTRAAALNLRRKATRCGCFFALGL